MRFDSHNFDWTLKQLKIFYGGSLIKNHLFKDGIEASGRFEKSIDLELSIADMKIPFFGVTKDFLFELVYQNCDDGNNYKARCLIVYC